MMIFLEKVKLIIVDLKWNDMTFEKEADLQLMFLSNT